MRSSIHAEIRFAMRLLDSLPPEGLLRRETEKHLRRLERELAETMLGERAGPRDSRVNRR